MGGSLFDLGAETGEGLCSEIAGGAFEAVCRLADWGGVSGLCGLVDGLDSGWGIGEEQAAEFCHGVRFAGFLEGPEAGEDLRVDGGGGLCVGRGCGLVLGGGWTSASPGFTESGLEVGEFDGFTDIVIHAGLDAGFAVAVEGIGGHGDDADAGAAGGSEVSFQLADAPGGLVTVEFGHLAVHEDSVIGEAAEGFDGFEAIGDGVGGAAEFSQLAQGDFLVYGVILGEEDAESEVIILGLAGFGVFAGEAGGMAEGVEEAGMKAGLAYWFYEVGIGADALPGMAVEVQSHGGEHDEPGLADAGGGTDFLGEV